MSGPLLSRRSAISVVFFLFLLVGWLALEGRSLYDISTLSGSNVFSTFFPLKCELRVRGKLKQ